MSYEPSRTSVMDKIFMMKELYAAVDHLEENLRFTNDDTESKVLQQTIKDLTALRRELVSSMDGDKNYACLFKHMAGAWKAAEEVWLAENDSESFYRYTEATRLFYWAAEKYLGKKLEQCSRCDSEKQETASGELQSIHDMRSTLGAHNATT